MKTCRRGHQYEDNLKTCGVCHKASIKAWKEANKEKEAANNKAWYQANKEQQNAYQNKYQASRKTNDPLYKLRCNIRSLICSSYKNQGFKKNTKTSSILGCDFETLQEHLVNSAFKRYDCYSDYFDYHIDHIKPVSIAATEQELLALNHYTNLQLLYPEDNINKSNSLDWNLK